MQLGFTLEDTQWRETLSMYVLDTMLIIAIRLHLQVENSFLGRFGAVPRRPPEVRRLR